jgi:DNA topoisomerase-3
MPDFPEPLELVGMNPLYTVKHGGYKQVLSVGRVQTTLAMVVDRFAAIEILNLPYWGYRHIEHLFLLKKVAFLKGRQGTVIKVKWFPYLKKKRLNTKACFAT